MRRQILSGRAKGLPPRASGHDGTRGGDRWYKPRPSQRAAIVLVHLCERTIYVKLVAGFPISESTAHPHVQRVSKPFVSRGSSLTQALGYFV